MFKKVTWLESDGSSLKLREILGQPARKQEHQSYNLKEVNSDNMHELRCMISRWEHSPADTLILAWWDPDQSMDPHLCTGQILTTENLRQ